MSPRNDTEMLAKVATMYYMDGMTQSNIAKLLDLSRSTVCNMISDAKNLGIVEINIHNPKKYNDILSKEIGNLYPRLVECYVIPTGVAQINILTKIIATQGAEIIASNLKSNSTIGIAWGSTTYEFMNAFNASDSLTNITVIPLIGGTDKISSEFQLNEMVRRFSKKLNGTPIFIYAPAHTETVEDKELYLQSKSMSEIKDRWNKLDAAIVSVGSMPEFYENPLLFDTKALFNPRIIRKMFIEDPERAVGDICGRQLNLNGEFLDNDNNKRLIAIDANDIKSIKKIYCIAGGSHKVLSIIGALKNDLVNCLILDENTAKSVIKLSNIIKSKL